MLYFLEYFSCIYALFISVFRCCRHIGREQGYGLMRVDCTSYFSARAIARLGFECVYELKYADYKENGQTVFVPEHPHNALTIYVQRISCTSP